jgi:hydrogenase-4 component B
VAFLDAIALAGVAGLALGGLTAALAGRLAAGLALQAAGTALLGACGAAVLLGADPIGAQFRSDVAPALGLDALSGFFLVVLAITAVPALAFARPYLRDAPSSRVVGSLTAAFLLALVGLLAARDVTTFLAFWELMTLVPAAAIVAARRDAPVRAAVFAYLAITHLGGAGVWIAMLTLAWHGAIGDPAALAAAGAGTQTLVAVAALVGFGTKAGLVPLHSWLPRAHPVAPAHLSALMSGVMIKVALYGLIRVEFEWLGATPRWLGIALLALGALSGLGGVLWALVQHDLKRLLAFHSIENVGIIVLALGASLLFADAGARDWAAIAFAAALLHVANHAIFKALLFLGAGAFERAVGALELDRLGGLLRRMPWTGGAFLVGSMAIAGLPPLNGFASEWLTLQSLLHVAVDPPPGVALAGAVALAALAATAALALLCFVKVVGLVLLGPPRRPQCAEASDAAVGMRAGMAALALLCVVLGLVPGLVVPTLAGLAPGASDDVLARHAGLAVPGTGSLPALGLAIALVALSAVLVRARGARRAAPAPTWACGQTFTPALSWTSAGFTKPLRLVLESVLRPRREIEVVERRGLVQSVSYSSEIPSLGDKELYEPAMRAGLRGAAIARRLQTGNVRTYALYLLALVVGLLALVRTGALG